MAAHRYWRIKSRQAGTYFSVEEIELRSAAGGADQTTPSTTISLGALQDGAATKAIDNSTATYCQQSPAANAYLLVDFGAGNAKDIVEVSITGSPHGTDRSPQEFDIQSSDDGVAFTDEWACSYASTLWTLGGTVVFTKPSAAAHRFWRLRVLTVATGASPGSGSLAISELQMRAAANGANVATGGAAICRTANASFPASNAFDGNSSTIYVNGTTWANAEYIGYDFGAGNAVTIAEIAWGIRSGFITQAPSSVVVESSPDGRSYLKRWAASNVPVSGDPAYLSRTTDPASVPVLGGGAHRYWGIRPTAIGTTGDVFALAELQLHASVGGANIASGGNGIAALPNFPPANAFGAGDYASSHAAGDVLLYDFGAASTVAAIREILIQARGTAPKQAPISGDIVYSDDGYNLTVDWSFATSDDWAGSETRTFSSPVVARPWVPRIITC